MLFTEGGCGLEEVDPGFAQAVSVFPVQAVNAYQILSDFTEGVWLMGLDVRSGRCCVFNMANIEVF